MERIGLGERTERLVAFEGWSLATRLYYDIRRQPDRPDYHFGNVVVLREPPEHDELDFWLDVWRQELGDAGLSKLVLSSETTDPDPPEGLAEAVAAAGLELEIAEILVLGTPVAVPPPEGVTIRPARDDEWPAITRLEVDRADAAGKAAFRRRQMRAYRRLVIGRRLARWWVALRDEDVVGSAGLFRGSKLARYQQIVVHPDHRRRGIATALVSAMACDHHGMWPQTQAVIVAERGSSAERIYRRVGFERYGSFLTVIGDPPPA